MRKLAETLGVVAMSLYYYVADKDEILDGMVLPPQIRAITLRPGQSSAPSASPCSARPGTSSTSPRAQPPCSVSNSGANGRASNTTDTDAILPSRTWYHSQVRELGTGAVFRS
jgi:hypothetical protein